MKSQITIRPANQNDVGFIFNSWLKSYKYSPFARNINNTIYYAQHHKVIENLLKSNQTYIACNTDSPDQIFGFANAGTVDGIFCIHYVYVKQSFRNFGIAKKLLETLGFLPNIPCFKSHHTKICEKLSDKEHYSKIEYCPYILPTSGASHDAKKES